jgi:hypothetical protein
LTLFLERSRTEQLSVLRQPETRCISIDCDREWRANPIEKLVRACYFGNSLANNTRLYLQSELLTDKKGNLTLQV